MMMTVMRPAVNSVQQTLTPEAASVLKHAVAEASRRGHAQATPLHVAASLLSAPGSLLREACLRTHPAHSSPLPKCRALELCFNIALERLQAAQCPLPGGQPSFNNALNAALKRAQAHQRRGCPEQQQQPLLAVKVELEQLIISILDDPSVSRVMREAGFSSTDVKNHLEENVSLVNPQHASTIIASCADPQSQLGFRSPPLGFTHPFPHYLSCFNALPDDKNDVFHIRPSPLIAPSSQLYVTPRFPKLVGLDARGAATQALLGDSRRVMNVLLQRKRRNPLLVGESTASLDAVIRDVMQRLERGDAPDQLKGVKILSLKLTALSVLSATKEELKRKFVELDESVGELKSWGVLVHLGDLQWLLQRRRNSSLSCRSSFEFCPVTYAVQEISNLLACHQGTCNGRLWLMSSASNHTFCGFQSQHSHLENEWELQLVPITPPSRFKNCESEVVENGTDGIDSSLTLSLHPSPVGLMKVLVDKEEISDPNLRCCSECMTNYEKEARCVREEERQAWSPPSCSTTEAPNMENATSPSTLPAWLRKAIPASSANKPDYEGKENKLAERLEDLRKHWIETCCSLHGHREVGPDTQAEKVEHPPASSHVNSGQCQDQPLSLLDNNIQPGQLTSSFPPIASDTCLQLTRMRNAEVTTSYLQCIGPKRTVQINSLTEHLQDLTGCNLSITNLPWQISGANGVGNCGRQGDAAASCCGKVLDVEALTRLCKGLSERIGWQKGVISTIANTVIQCRSGRSKRYWSGFKGDTWLLLLGQDHAGKRKMAEALAELIFGCEKNPVYLTLGNSSVRQEELSLTSDLILAPAPYRGKMPLDRVADAIRQNPSSLVLMLEDVEQADLVCKLALLKAMERGRLQDSSGRELSFNNAIVLLASSVGVEVDCIRRIPRKEIPSSKSSQGKSSMLGAHDNMGETDASCDHRGVCCLENLCTESLAMSRKRKGKQEFEGLVACKKLNIMGQSLSLDLNMSVEDHTAHDDPQGSACEEGRANGVSDEHVLFVASRHLKEFYSLVDAAVVFSAVPTEVASGSTL